jgi:hypothetical protein
MKILKLERLMKKTCKDIGIDKNSLMMILMGGGGGNAVAGGIQEFGSSSRKEQNSGSKEMKDSTKNKDGGVVNTGLAA